MNQISSAAGTNPLRTLEQVQQQQAGPRAATARASSAALAAGTEAAGPAGGVGSIASQLSKLIDEARTLAARAATDAGRAGSDADAARSRFDAITGEINRLADRAGVEPGGTGVLRQALVAPAPADPPIGDATGTGTPLTPTAGGLFIETGPDLNLGGVGSSDGLEEQFAIELAGADGARELSFASGSTVADIAAAINASTGETGVRASVSSTSDGTIGLRLEATDPGADGFVSVRVLDDGGGLAGGGTVYELGERDASVLGGVLGSVGDAVEFEDFGRDAVGPFVPPAPVTAGLLDALDRLASAGGGAIADAARDAGDFRDLLLDPTTDWSAVLRDAPPNGALDVTT